MIWGWGPHDTSALILKEHSSLDYYYERSVKKNGFGSSD